MMKKRLTFVLIVWHIILGHAQQTHRADIYITPRNVNYGWGDNGVFHFKFEKKSIKVPFKERTYGMLTTKRRVYELYYKRAKMPDSLYLNLKATDEKILKARIMIVVSPKDSIFIDTHYNVAIKNKCYKISNAFKSYLECLMPITIRENWQNDIRWR
jgi:hypothetical protein